MASPGEIEQIGGDLLSVNQGTLYSALLRLKQEDAIALEWSPSVNNRRAGLCRLARAGQRLLEAEIIARFFEVKAQDLA